MFKTEIERIMKFVKITSKDKKLKYPFEYPFFYNDKLFINDIQYIRRSALSHSLCRYEMELASKEEIKLFKLHQKLNRL